MKFDLVELKKITLLYVEDEEMIRTQTVSMFENLFKKTYVGTNGSEGLQLFNKNKNEIDIVISDINMPELSGLEMVEEIHKINIKVPIILTTAYTDEEYLLKSLELNIYKYITKPLKIKDLTINIIEAVKKYNAEKKLTKTAKNLASQNTIVQNELSQLQDDVLVNKKEMELQKHIINDYISYLKIDKNGIIKHISKKFSSLYGYTKQEILEQHVTILSDNNSFIQKKFLEAIKKKTVINFTTTFNTKADNKLLFACELFPLYESNDGMVSGYDLYQDIYIS